MMRKRWNLSLAAAGLALFIFCIYGITVSGQSAGDGRGGYDRQLEKAYLHEVDELLEEQGFFNAGVTMTYVRETDGSRMYQVMIHHRRIDRMEENERTALQEQFSSISLQVPDSVVRQDFLRTEHTF